MAMRGSDLDSKRIKKVAMGSKNITMKSSALKRIRALKR